MDPSQVGRPDADRSPGPNPTGAAGLEVGPARTAEIRPLAELWCEAFPGPRTVDDRVRMLETGGRYGGLETVLVARGSGDRVLGACKLYRMEQWILGTALPMMGLAAVAVPSSERRRGIGARLCVEAVRRAAERGDIISALYPFRPDYYERLGWGLVGALHDHRFRTDHLPRYPEAGHVREAEVGDSAGVADCYERVASRSHGPIARDARVWAYRLSGEEIGVRPVEADAGSIGARRGPRQLTVVYDQDGIRGYALLRQVTTRARGDRSLQVRELVAETEEAYRGLLGHIADRADEWPLARHFARPEEQFGDRLRDPRPPRHRPARSLYFPTHRVVRGPMLRVLDVPTALRRRPWYHAGDGRAAAAVLRITVDDPEIPSNQGPWTVRLDGSGGGTVIGADPAGGDPDSGAAAALSTDASTFARVYAGELAPTASERLGRATLRGDRLLLDRAFAARERFWLLDEF